MSENYTPSIDRLRSAYVKDAFNGWRGIKTPEQRQQTNAEFDRAIAAHDAELREQIAREILDERLQAATEPFLREYITGLRSGLVMAASIARGKEQA